jgi:microcystin degradation protein MlrC
MRIASGGVQHETNTFAVGGTTLEDFVRDSNCGPDLAGGDVIVSRFGETGSIHGGYIAAGESEQFELLPLLCTRAQPSGVVEQSCFDELLGKFLTRLKEQLPVDGVLLDLHGAMVTDKHQDAEGEFIRAVVELVGDDTPIVTTLDLHANISPQMAQLSNVIIGFDTYPHVDMFERGFEAGCLLANMIRGNVTPVQSYRQLPMLTMPPMQCTLREPMRSVIQTLHAWESRAEILTATISMGFPFADIADAGVSVLVSSDNRPDLASQACDDLARRLWRLRGELEPQLTPIGDVIERARQRSLDGPIVFADGSDNPGGGAPCDGTVALEALIKSKLPNSVVGVIYDPETAAQAHRAGVGETISVRLGGKTDDRHGAPVCGDAYVRSLCDGRFVYRGRMLRGVEDHLGLTATLVLGGVEVVVSSVRRQCLDAEMLRIAGIDPTSRSLIVLKSAVHFRADFSDMASEIFDADTPGVHRPDFSEVDYRNVRRPIYPLDRDLDWQIE